MSYRCFDVTESDQVAHVVLNRPDELNTMVPEFWTELPEIIEGALDGMRFEFRGEVERDSGKDDEMY